MGACDVMGTSNEQAEHYFLDDPEQARLLVGQQVPYELGTPTEQVEHCVLNGPEQVRHSGSQQVPYEATKIRGGKQERHYVLASPIHVSQLE